MQHRHGWLLTAALALLLVCAAPLWAQQPAPLAQTYTLGPGDVVEVSVWGNEDLSRTVTVRPDGRISLPMLGAVTAAGLTPEQLQVRLTELYKRYIKQPQIAIIVVQFRRIKVAVLGQVARPGTYELPPAGTLLDLISAAGGITELAAVGQAQLIRDNRQVQALDLDAVLKGNERANLTLQDRDVVVVPENLNDVVYVIGEVQKPGAYRLRQPMTLLDLLVMAGGMTANGSVTQARLLRNKHDVVPVNFDALLLKGDLSHNVPVQGGDMVFIPEDRENRVYVLGEVSRPGVYPLRDASTLLKALAAVGGPSSRAALREGYVIRRAAAPGSAGQQVIKVDLDALIRRGDLRRDMPLQAGDVLYIPERPLSMLAGGLQTILSILVGLRVIFP
jgi:polysaccharide export outer membrane protein